MLGGAFPQTQPQSGGVGGLQGSRISLISKSEIRYEGYLYSINPDENTVALRNVRMFGTEGRKKDGPQIPPGDQLYEFIIFRGSDIKDLTVFDAASQRPVEPSTSHPPDPAILNAWQAAPQQNWRQQPSRPMQSQPQWGRQQYQNQNRGNWDYNQRDRRPAPRLDRRDDRPNYEQRGYGRDNRYDRRDDRRQDDRRPRDDRGPPRGQRQSRGASGGGGQRGYGGGYNKRRNNSSKHTGRNFRVSENPKKEFTEEFNFEESNKRLDLDKVATEFKEKAEAAEKAEDVKIRAQFTTASTYDKAKGFFDEISCEALERKFAGTEPKRLDREMREQQKQLDQETFGTATLMDVGGYGYGPRRGGFRGRRSGAGGGQSRNFGGSGY